ncbi:MAG: hypothetical protein ACRYGG_20290 [Janthinobacterium lividum]
MSKVDYLCCVVRDICRAFELWAGILKHGPEPETAAEKKARLKKEALCAEVESNHEVPNFKLAHDDSMDEIIASLDNMLVKPKYQFPITSWVGYNF